MRRGPWLIAAMLALLVQSLYPAGYMPGNLADGWLAAICPDGMPKSFMHALDGGHHQHDKSTADEDCQLGSALDAPLTLAVLAKLPEPIPLVAHIFVRRDGMAVEFLRSPRSRAPPIA